MTDLNLQQDNHQDKVNNKIKGLNKLNVTRKTGKAMLKNNFINKR